VKKEREEMKRKLKSLKEAQEPLLRKIRSVESQLQPIEQQMKEMVSTNHKHYQESVYLPFYVKVMPLFIFFRPPVSERHRRNVNRNMISLNCGIKRFVLKEEQLAKYFKKVLYISGS